MSSPSFSNPHTAADLDRLQLLLIGTMNDAGVCPPHDVGKTTQLLNLACGRADESAVLANVFGSKTGNIHLTGIDIRDREIDEARERWQTISEQAETDFLVHDASRLGELTELSDAFDIAFMRHQNFWNGDNTWTKIYDEALHRLNKDGLLVITSYFDREHQLALDAIQGLGAELVCSEKNKNSRKLYDAPAKSVDRHIAIFKKPV